MVIARVVPTRDTARRSMSEVEVGNGVLEVVRRIEFWVAGCVRRVVRSFVVVKVLEGGMLFTRCVRAAGTFVSVCSMSATIWRLWEKR